jgi:outer membrane protein OmpA-like peptidoglycan-associated protein
LAQFEDAAVRKIFAFLIVIALLVGTAFGLAFIGYDGQLKEPLAQIARFSSQFVKDPSALLREIDELTDPTRDAATAAGEESRESSSVAAIKGARSRNSPRLPSLDIARIGADGVSVFAGQAEPFQQISVRYGELTLGYAQADAQGNWSLVTEQKIADPGAKFSVAAGPFGAQEPDQADRNSDTVASRKSFVSVGEVNRQLMASLEKLADDARRTANDANATTARRNSNNNSAAERGASHSVDFRPIGAGVSASGTNDAGATGNGVAGTGVAGTGSTDTVAPHTRTADLRAAGGTSASSAAPQKRSRTIPVPIQFVYRRATFTDQGDRAAHLLLEFLKASRIEEVTLSGHADERGTEELNMRLSRERLEAVRDYLREGGYEGRFVLIPKGESEPFTGVDRHTVAIEDLYQLDRRVELHLED